MRLMLLLLCMLAVAGCDRQKAESQQGAEAAAAGLEVGLIRTKKGTQAPAVEFIGPDGEPASFEDFRGKPVLVNLWATWCAPCVKELPTLDALAASDAVQVLAISQDRAPNASVAAFLEDLGTKQLEAFQDPTMALSGALGVQVLPTSIFYDAQGREVWRYVGDRDWSAANVRPLLAEAR